MKSAGRACPSCGRILLPTRAGAWPPHFSGPRRQWCPRTDQPHPVGAAAPIDFDWSEPVRVELAPPVEVDGVRVIYRRS